MQMQKGKFPSRLRVLAVTAIIKSTNSNIPIIETTAQMPSPTFDPRSRQR
jgi:hypothetical protein